MKIQILVCGMVAAFLLSPEMVCGQAATANAAAGSIPQLPTPAGKYGIGRIGYDWTDTSRHDLSSSDPQSHRELMVYLWYPAARNPRIIKGPYLPGARLMDAAPETRKLTIDEFGANWPLILSGAIYSHVQENAAVKKLPLFPLMVFSYGAGGSGFEYTALIEDLVSRGYVVATIEHPQSAFAVVFPDGRLVPYHVDSPPPGLSQQEQWQRFMRLASVGIEEGAADVRFVLNMLSEMSQGDAKRFPLAGKLDMSRVAVMGHSAGAESAARACDLDSRIKACIDLDGGMVPVAALPESGDGAVPLQPLLFLEAYHPESKMFGTHEQHEAYLRKREEQLQSCPKGTFAVVLKSPGMVHGSFDDTPLLEAGGHPQETAQALHNLQLSQAYIRAFLDKTLNHQDRTLLDEDVPEASVVRYPH